MVFHISLRHVHFSSSSSSCLSCNIISVDLSSGSLILLLVHIYLLSCASEFFIWVMVLFNSRISLIKNIWFPSLYNVLYLMRLCHFSVTSLSMISLNSLNIFIMAVLKSLLKLTFGPSHRQFLLSASLLIYRSQFCFFQYLSFLKMRHFKLYIVLILDINFPCPQGLYFVLPLFVYWPPPGGSDGKASVYNVGYSGSIPGSGRSPGEGNGSPLRYSCLENPMDGGAW